MVVSKWFITILSKSPKDRVVGPLPNGHKLWLINRGDPIYLQVLGAHPPSYTRLSSTLLQESRNGNLVVAILNGRIHHCFVLFT